MSALSGCRVLDLGIVTAGAGAAAVLADLGAEVIKVESPTYRDPFRQWSADTRIDADAPVPPFFRATNRNKAGISVDLKSADGREIFLRLVEKSDFVIENFRRGVMVKLGLGYDVLRSRNAGIILASVASQGETGPDAHYVSFGSTLDAASGLAWLTGYPGEEPMVTGVDLNYPDQVTTIFAASLMMSALLARRAGKGGAHLDISQRELASYLIGEQFLAEPGAGSTRQGNRQAPYVLQDCFRCNDGVWLAASVRDDQRTALGRLVGEVAPTAAGLAGWCAERTSAQAMVALQSVGVASAPSLGGAAVLATRGLGWQDALLPMADGAFVKGFPFQLEHQPLEIRRDAPKLGNDTRDILARIAGYAGTEIDALIASGVVEQRSSGSDHMSASE